METTIQKLEIMNYEQYFHAVLSIETAREFKTILETLAKFTDESLNLYLNEDGIAIRFMDASGAIFVNSTLDKAAFIEYQTSGSLVLNFSPNDIANILKTAREEERIVFSYPALKSQGFDFGLDGTEKQAYDRFGISFDNGFKERLYDVPRQIVDDDGAIKSVTERALAIPMETSVSFSGNILIKNIVDMKIRTQKGNDPFNVRVQIDEENSIKLALADNSLDRNANVKIVLRKNDSPDCKILNIEWGSELGNVEAVYGFEYLIFLAPLDSIANTFDFAFSNSGPYRLKIEKENFEFVMVGAPIETEEQGEDEEEPEEQQPEEQQPEEEEPEEEQQSED